MRHVAAFSNPMNEGQGTLFPVEPLDEHNRALLASVRPPGWRNPRPARRYHLVVVGGGTAGLVSAVGAAGLGARVALVERHLLGGDCLNVGCVPSKALIRAARAWWEAGRAAAEFGGPAVAPPPSESASAGPEPGSSPEATRQDGFAAAMARMRRLRAGISPHDGAARLSGLGIDVFLGQGRFAGRDTVEVDGERLRFRRAVIATGARAAIPELPGLAESGYRTNETVFNLTTLPPRLAVVGAGPIGCEISQAFARFGSSVTLFSRGSRVLPREDGDAAALVAGALARDGVGLELGAKLLEVRRAAGGKRLVFEREGRRHESEADEVLVAVGRTANVDGLGLEAAGVRFTPRGVEVDDRLRTSSPHIFAAGDVTDGLRFTHLADAHARLVIQNALFFGRSRASALTVPWCTYTSPEVAHVGLGEREAEARGLAVETLTLPLSTNDRAVLEGEEEGFLRLHLARGSDRIVGATLVAQHAGEMLGGLCLAVTHRIGLGKIGSVIHPYPTQAAILRQAADAWRRRKLTPGVSRLLGWWFRLFR